MVNQNDGGPAFPHPTEGFWDNPEKGIGFNVFTGMSLRDYFAGQVIQGAMENRSLPCNPTEAAIVASHTYMLADAMLKARQK